MRGSLPVLTKFLLLVYKKKMRRFPFKNLMFLRNPNNLKFPKCLLSLKLHLLNDVLLMKS